MAKLTNQDIVVRAGDTLVIQATTKDDSGTVVDLTGALITWSMAEKVGSPIILTKTVGSGITITNPAGGVFRVTVVPADTQSLPAQDYYHEAEITDAGGQIQTSLRGKLTIERVLI